MPFTSSVHCFTRLIVDGRPCVELADHHAVNRRIQQRLLQQSPQAPPSTSDAALLSLASCLWIADPCAIRKRKQ